MHANDQRLTILRLWELTKESGAAWLEDYAPGMGAALADHTVFSLAPLLILMVAIGGLVFGEKVARGEIVAQLGGLLGENGATAVEAFIMSANHPAKSITASIVAVGTLLVGATSVLNELQTVLNRI